MDDTESVEDMFPPYEDLEILFDLSMKGDVFEIRKKAKVLAESDCKLKSLSAKLVRMADSLMIEEIQILIEQLLTKEK